MNASNAVIDSTAVTTPVQSVRPDLIAVETQHPARGLRRGEKLPTLREAAVIARNIITSQDARDFEVKLRDLRISPLNGGLFNSMKSDGKDASAYTHAGLQQLMSYAEVPRNFTAALEFLPPAERAAAANYALTRAPQRTVFIRTVKHNDTRIVRSTTSERHSLDAGDDLALWNALVQNFDGDRTRVKAVRGWDRTYIELFMPDSLRGDVPVVGGVSKKLTLSNSETKMGSIETMAGLFTLVCLNGMTRATDSTEVSVRHIGRDQMARKIRSSIRIATEGLDGFMEQFGNTFSVALPATRADTIERAVSKLALPENVGTAMRDLWDVDGVRSGGDTLGGLVQSMTRASQPLPYAQALAIEAAAGELVRDGLKALGF